MVKVTRTIEKITARVFCQLQGGGNPVTIFASTSSADTNNNHKNHNRPDHHNSRTPFFLSNATQKRLAQTCAWESVMVDCNLRQMSFFMPTGEPVSFCAHAAMGGALPLGQQQHKTPPKSKPSTSDSATTTTVNFTTSLLPPSKNDNTDTQPTSHQHNNNYQAVLHDKDVVSLEMTTTTWEEKRITMPSMLYRILRDKMGLTQPDKLSPLSINRMSPSFCNASIVGRPKTLVHVPSVDILHGIRLNPSMDRFRIACDAIESTGIYLYTQRPKDDTEDDDDESDVACSSWECRQFPRASGYPEDPATGIAAAALAASIDRRRRRYLTTIKDKDAAAAAAAAAMRYKFYQGTAMGQPSLIMVENLQWDNNNTEDLLDKNEATVSFQLIGRTEIDSRETIQVEDEEEEFS